jgi:acyl carrier protein
MSWTHDEVVDEVRAVILDHVDTSANITVQTELVADLGIDSLGVMEVVADIEDKFEMTIADKELRDVATLGDVVKAIEVRLASSGRLAE